ncbi:MAG TPA: DUF4339 domain-containing protein [Bauldia sp.]|nr:DUF4339 domain-containing protein [Bauldia sp.]
MMLRAILGAAVLAAAIAAPPAWSADKPGPALHASVIDGIAEALLQDGATAPQRSGFVMGAGPDASPKYYFENGGSVAGPISFSELTARLAAGTIRLDTVLWKEGMAAWMQARYLPEIAVLYDRRTDRPAVTPAEPPVEVLPVAPAPQPAVAPSPAPADTPPAVAPAAVVAPTGPAIPANGPTGPAVADVAPAAPVQPADAVTTPTGPTGPAVVPAGPAVAPATAPPAGPAQPEPAAVADPAFTEYMVGTWTFPDNGNPPSILTANLLPTGEITGTFDTAPPNRTERIRIAVSGRWIAARIDATHLGLTLDMLFKLNDRASPVKTVTPLEIVDHDTLRDAGGGLNKRAPG